MGAYAKDRDVSKSEKLIGGAANVARKTNKYILTFAAMIYAVTMRILLFSAWLPFILPFLFASAVDGYARRQIKFVEFGEYGATIFASALHISVLLLATPILYFISPIPITPYFVPIWGFMVALPVSIMVSNANQLLPR
jgi:hypothetical protein